MLAGHSSETIDSHQGKFVVLVGVLARWFNNDKGGSWPFLLLPPRAYAAANIYLREPPVLRLGKTVRALLLAVLRLTPFGQANIGQMRRSARTRNPSSSSASRVRSALPCSGAFSSARGPRSRYSSSPLGMPALGDEALALLVP